MSTQNLEEKEIMPELPEELAETPISIGKEKNKKKIVISLKAIIITAIVLAVLVLAFIFKGLFVAAMIDGSPISRAAVIRELETVSGKSALDSLITEKLIRAEAKQKNVSVNTEEISAEIKKIEDQLKTQGSTLAQALTAQGMTQKTFEKQIFIQKTLEKLLADKAQVSAEEITQYIADNKIEIPAGQEESYKNQIQEELRQQKLSTEANTLISSLRAKAKINYFIKY